MKVKSFIMIVALLLATFIVFNPVVKSAAKPSLKVEYDNPAYPPVNPPTKFLLNIKVYDVSLLHDWEFYLRWNPYIIRLLNVTEGNWAPTSTDFNYYLSSLGEYVQVYSGLWLNASSASGNKTLAKIWFECYDTGDAFTIDMYDDNLWQLGLVPIDHDTFDANFYNTYPVVNSKRKVLTDVSGQRVTDVDPAPNDTVRFDARKSYAQPKLVGDINRDGQVTGADLSVLGGNWYFTETTPGFYWDADIDLSGKVDGADLSLLGGNWYKSGGYINNFKWDFGDGTIVQGKDKSVVIHVFTNYSNSTGFPVTLTVTDGNARSWTKTQLVKIWRDIAAIDVWPCYDDYLGNYGVMPNDNLTAGTILFITGAYRNMGTLKQTWTVRIFLRETTSLAEVTLFTRTRTNQPPPSKADSWYPPTATGTGMEVNDPNMTKALSTNAKLKFVDYDADGAYTLGGTERPIWDTDASGNVTVGDIDCTAGALIEADDPDIDTTLTSDAHLKWVDNNANGIFDIGERVYYDTDASGTVNAGDYYINLDPVYEVVFDAQIFSIPAGTYMMVITVTTTQGDLNSLNNEFDYSPIFNVVP